MDEYVLYSAEAILTDDPQTVSEALNRQDAEQWKLAMMEEYKSLTDNNTWTLQNPPKNVKPINSRYNLEIEQLDAVTAFLQGDLTEEIYMVYPEGVSRKIDDKFCKLNKVIYGLKQASRE